MDILIIHNLNACQPKMFHFVNEKHKDQLYVSKMKAWVAWLYAEKTWAFFESKYLRNQVKRFWKQRLYSYNGKAFFDHYSF